MGIELAYFRTACAERSLLLHGKYYASVSLCLYLLVYEDRKIEEVVYTSLCIFKKLHVMIQKRWRECKVWKVCVRDFISLFFQNGVP